MARRGSSYGARPKGSASPVRGPLSRRSGYGPQSGPPRSVRSWAEQFPGVRPTPGGSIRGGVYGGR